MTAFQSAIIVAGLAGTTPAWSQSGRWRADDRVVIADFSHVEALAASGSALYAATTEGLIIYDRRFNRWEPPLTRIDGFPDAPVRSALVDPADESLWLGSDLGLIHYRPQLRQIEVLQTGPVSDLIFDRDDPIRGLYFRGQGGGWEVVPRGGLMSSPATDLPPVTRRVQAVSLQGALQRFPAAEAMGATTLLDRRLRRHDYTSAAVAPGGGEVFFGTDGLGVYRLDPNVARLEPLAFGLRNSLVGALVAIPNAVWVGTNETRGGPGGFTRIGEDYQTVRYEEGGTAAPEFREAHELIARGLALWAATDRGIFRFPPGGAWHVIGVGEGLPSDLCLALDQGSVGVWVGTDRGLALVDDENKATPVGNSRVPVFALAATRDSVWVGTTKGLGLVAPGANEIAVPADVALEPALSRAIVAIARSADTVVVATPERIVWKAPGGAWKVERVLSELGELRTLASERGGVWIGGQRGLAFFRFSGRSVLTFHAPEDLPGAVTKIASAGPYLWVATDRGLVRFAKRALLP